MKKNERLKLKIENYRPCFARMILENSGRANTEDRLGATKTTGISRD